MVTQLQLASRTSARRLDVAGTGDWASPQCTSTWTTLRWERGRASFRSLCILRESSHNRVRGRDLDWESYSGSSDINEVQRNMLNVANLAHYSSGSMYISMLESSITSC